MPKITLNADLWVVWRVVDEARDYSGEWLGPSNRNFPGPPSSPSTIINPVGQDSPPLHYPFLHSFVRQYYCRPSSRCRSFEIYSTTSAERAPWRSQRVALPISARFFGKEPANQHLTRQIHLHFTVRQSAVHTALRPGVTLFPRSNALFNPISASLVASEIQSRTRMEEN